MNAASAAFLGLVTVLFLTEVNAWYGFKKLPAEKKEWLRRIAVKQGLHLERHVKEMRALARSKRASDSYSRCSGGGGRGGGGSSTVLDTIVVTAPRLPQSPARSPIFPRPPLRFPIGGGGGGAPPPPPKEEKQEDQEPPEDKDAKKMTYQQFVHALETLEKLFPDMPADEMAHKLRMLVSRYDSALWKVMLNVNNPTPFAGRDISPFQQNAAQKQTFDLLTQMMDHRFQNGAELGVIKINGETVAFGHVITGSTAGYDHQTVLGMDNLFATTISGDLGQSALANSKDATSPIIGPAGKWQNGKYMIEGKGGFATHAEIIGDIDGFNIGKRIMADPSKQLSQHFKEYYGGESQKRFETFTKHTTKAQLRQEVFKFANLYDYKDAGLLSSVLQNSSPELAIRRLNEINRISDNAVNTFCTRYSSKLGSWC